LNNRVSTETGDAEQKIRACDTGDVGRH
jgi:hypothetical protein